MANLAIINISEFTLGFKSCSGADSVKKFFLLSGVSKKPMSTVGTFLTFFHTLLCSCFRLFDIPKLNNIVTEVNCWAA